MYSFVKYQYMLLNSLRGSDLSTPCSFNHLLHANNINLSTFTKTNICTNLLSISFSSRRKKICHLVKNYSDLVTKTVDSPYCLQQNSSASTRPQNGRRCHVQYAKKFFTRCTPEWSFWSSLILCL